MNLLLSILYGIIVGAGWSLYLWKMKTTEQDWDECKFLRTVLVGGVAGLILALMGQEVTQETIAPYIAETSALTIFIDALLKKLFWKCKK